MDLGILSMVAFAFEGKRRDPLTRVRHVQPEWRSGIWCSMGDGEPDWPPPSNVEGAQQRRWVLDFVSKQVLTIQTP